MEHEPVTRSQAKRILSQCESFKEVILDFEKVQYISQGFSEGKKIHWNGESSMGTKYPFSWAHTGQDAGGSAPVYTWPQFRQIHCTGVSERKSVPCVRASAKL